jgi:hypothetical protein
VLEQIVCIVNAVHRRRLGETTRAAKVQLVVPKESTNGPTAASRAWRDSSHFKQAIERRTNRPQLRVHRPLPAAARGQVPRHECLDRLTRDRVGSKPTAEVFDGTHVLVQRDPHVPTTVEKANVLFEHRPDRVLANARTMLIAA